jgi:hypothetical protein
MTGGSPENRAGGRYEKWRTLVKPLVEGVPDTIARAKQFAGGNASIPPA